MPARDAEETQWTWLYRLGGVAAMVTALLVPVAIAAHVLWPPPPWEAGAAADWFRYVQDNRLAGLLNLDLLLAVSVVLSVALYLALYVTLRHAGQSAMVVGTAIALLGAALHLTSNTAIELVAFSDAYSAATTDAQRAVYVAAGETALSAYYGMAFQVSYVLGYGAYIVIGAVMIKSGVFSRATGYLGVVTGVAGFGFYLPRIGLFVSVFDVLLIAAWNVIVARRLFQLARNI